MAVFGGGCLYNPLPDQCPETFFGTCSLTYIYGSSQQLTGSFIGTQVRQQHHEHDAQTRPIIMLSSTASSARHWDSYRCHDLMSPQRCTLHEHCTLCTQSPCQEKFQGSRHETWPTVYPAPEIPLVQHDAYSLGTYGKISELVLRCWQWIRT